MADYPPFMNAYGLLTKILEKIKEAQTPDRFTQDFLGTKLGFPSGSAMAFIPFAKRLGLLASDGSPTELYKSFRNPSQSKAAMAKAIRNGYAELYSRNEYLHDLDAKKLQGLVMEVTGLEQGHATIRSICGSIQALKSFADFEGKDIPEKKKATDDKATTETSPSLAGQELGMNLSYIINLVLPKTDDIGVFNAIFKSLKENLLKK